MLNQRARIYVPCGGSSIEALGRTTHLGIVAHPDDLEILAFHGIAECFYSKDKTFFGLPTDISRTSLSSS